MKILTLVFISFIAGCNIFVSGGAMTVKPKELTGLKVNNLPEQKNPRPSSPNTNNGPTYEDSSNDNGDNNYERDENHEDDDNYEDDMSHRQSNPNPKVTPNKYSQIKKKFHTIQ